MNGTCCGCGQEIEVDEFEGVIVVKSHHDRTGEICDGSHQPPVREIYHDIPY